MLKSLIPLTGINNESIAIMNKIGQITITD